MVDRGNCTFVAKVRNIENLGIKMAIVVDNRDEESESLVMSDDGTGHSVHIPSFIIRKSDGKIIKDHIKNDPENISSKQSVYVKGELLLARPDNRVEYELWYASILDMNYEKLNDIGLY
jgi:RNase P/RNase MRP subunit p29